MTKLKAADLFDGLDPEERQKITEFKVEPSKISELERLAIEGIEKVIAARYGWDDAPHVKSLIFGTYNKILPSCTADEIAAFSIALGPLMTTYQYACGITPDALGQFLNMLILRSPDEKITLYTAQHPYSLNCIANYNERKEILVKGHAGTDCAQDLRGGKLTIEGHCENLGPITAGDVIVHGNVSGAAGTGMTGGTLHVKGNASSVGPGMKAGTITIEGDSNEVGYHMAGGTIHLNGSYTRMFYTGWGALTGGDIYLYGKHIVKDGKQLRDQ